MGSNNTCNVILQLGSNLGDRLANLSKANFLIQESIGTLDTKSKIYETEPWGGVSSGNFLNQVIRISTEYAPLEVLRRIHEIEDKLGRTRLQKWGNRIIDIDILFYEKLIIKVDELVVPHPEIPNRMFVLKPLEDIASTFVHPIFNSTISKLKQNCQDDLAVSLYV